MPLVPTSHLKHAVESYEVNRPITQESIQSTNKPVSTAGPARSKKVDVSSIVQKTVEELLGTVVPNDAPLMGAGLDSIAAVDLVSTLSQRLDTELEPTALFDYPTVGSLIKYLDEQMEPEIVSAQEGNVVSIAPQPEAGVKTIQECFVVATAMYLPTVEGSFTNGDLVIESLFLDTAENFATDSDGVPTFAASANVRTGNNSLVDGFFPGQAELNVPVSATLAADTFFETTTYIGAFAPTETSADSWAIRSSSRF